MLVAEWCWHHWHHSACAGTVQHLSHSAVRRLRPTLCAGHSNLRTAGLFRARPQVGNRHFQHRRRHRVALEHVKTATSVGRRIESGRPRRHGCLTTVRAATPPKPRTRKWPFSSAAASPCAHSRNRRYATRINMLAALPAHGHVFTAHVHIASQYGACADPAKIAGSRINFTSCTRRIRAVRNRVRARVLCARLLPLPITLRSVPARVHSHALDYRGCDDPAKITGSRIVFVSRTCVPAGLGAGADRYLSNLSNFRRRERVCVLHRACRVFASPRGHHHPRHRGPPSSARCALSSGLAAGYPARKFALALPQLHVWPFCVRCGRYFAPF